MFLDFPPFLLPAVLNFDLRLQMWRYFMLYLHGYNLELFDRLKESRSQSNAQRVHVTSANPHMFVFSLAIHHFYDELYHFGPTSD